MAIAPLPEQLELEYVEMPWPRPALRLVTSPDDREAAVKSEVAVRPLRVVGDASSVPVMAAPVRSKRPLRSTIRTRRLVALAALATVLIALALPLRALGAVTVSGQPTPGGTPAGLVDGSAYVVQPGDTLASIAHKVAPAGDQARVVSELRQAVGSSSVVAGEHVILP